MAKKLIYNYTFDASAQTIKIKGNYTLRTLILITNVTDGILIYNFADPTAGATTSYDSALDETTITLEYDTTSMSDSDEIQILLDVPENEFEPSEALLDPVHKFRVSNPQNLIDTDFEYGLQSSKWETVELVNNIPSTFTRNSSVSIAEISQINTIENSDIVTVICTTQHNLAVGDPIEVQGTKSRTANGKYIITSIASNFEFTYRASAVQSTTENIRESYTTIIPGSFFAGSEILYDKNEGIATDNADPSTLTFTTNFKHGLTTGSSLYITNTVGKKIFNISNTSATASDGNAVINSSDETIFLAGHNFFNDQKLFIYPNTASNPSAVLPTLSTGAPDPQGTTLINTVYNSVNTALASIKSTMGADHSRFFMQFFNTTQAYYITSTQSIVPREGASTFPNDVQTQYLIYGEYSQNISHAVTVRSNQTNLVLTNYFWSPNGEGNSILYTGQPVDFGAYFTTSTSGFPSTLSGKLYGQWTPFVQNSYADFIVSVKQFDTSITDVGTRIQYSDQSWRSKYPTTINYQSRSEFNTFATPTSLGNGWNYTYAYVYYYPHFGSFTGHIKLDIVLWNTSYTNNFGTTSSWSQNSFTNSTRSLLSFDNAIRGPHYRIEALIGLDADANSNRYGQSGSVLTTAQMASSIATEVSNNLSYASWNNNTGINTVRARVVNGNRITLTNDEVNRSPYVFSNSGTGPIVVETEQVAGVVDNFYPLSSVTATTGIITATSQIPPRILEFTNVQVVNENSDYYIKIEGGHGLEDGSKVVFNLESGSSIGGLSDATTYYAIVADNLYLRLASSIENWQSQTNVISGLPASTGSYNLTVSSVSGRVAASGTIDLIQNSNVVTGTNTKFLSNYKVGDNFNVVSVGATVNGYISNRVSSVVSDTTLSLENVSGFTTTGAQHFVDTKINVRADGQFLHRPFDGGVEITAGQSPDSQIVRQTRKYFRYQSGKGIQCSVAINFNPFRPIRLAEGVGTAVTMTTEYPHGLGIGNTVAITGASDSTYNGTFDITDATDFTFSYTADSSVSEANPTGFIEYAIDSYQNAGVRCGLFDFQNGFFYEYDGSQLYAVRRSSVQQLPGTIIATNKSNIVIGNNTRFQDGLSAGDMIVIRGQSYKVTSVESQTQIHISPSYKGVATNGAIVTKTIDVKVPQSQWNIDKADGTGPSGFNLDIHKIQMAYMDYSWYGAGKIRFGFKDVYGRVKYVHEFIHNNRQNEAYMRSGNIPGRYEVFNTGTPTFVPSLFHWGTSVIMDGRFDNDDSYLFTAAGNTLTFTNGDSASANAIGDSTLVPRQSGRATDWFVRIPFATADASKFAVGIPLYTIDGQLNGQTVASTQFGTSSFNVDIFIQRSFAAPAIYPEISSGTTVNIGAPSVGTGAVDLSTRIPLISIRLAPSVDNSIIGAIGERDIINRMQLKLKELGVSISHDSTITVVLNGNLSNLSYQNVGTPSLSQYVAHEIGDTINGGTTVYQFRASGGSEDANGKRFSQSSVFDLTPLSDLGNSILGGDDVFPNGPDIMTICATVIDTTEVDSGSSFRVSSRISWAESQA